MRKICIYGAGAIGGHLAANLARGGFEVSVVARGEQLKAIRDNGLQFIGPDDTFTVYPKAASDPSELGMQDLVIVTVKSHALPDVASNLQPLLNIDTPVVCAVNGIPWWYFKTQSGMPPDSRLTRLDPLGKLWRQIGDRALGCVISSPNEVVSPGVIRNARPQNQFVIGEPDNTASERLQAIVTRLQPALPGVSMTQSIREAVWNKLMLNLAGSPLSSLTACPWIEFTQNDEMVAIFRALISEATEVAARHGVQVTTTADHLLTLMRQVRHVPSMLQDLQAGRTLEVDAILRAVQDLAAAKKVPTPTLDIATALLAQRARAAH